MKKISERMREFAEGPCFFPEVAMLRFARAASKLENVLEHYKSAAKALDDLCTCLDTCHICKGTLVVEDSIPHCENHSSDCQEHEQPDCITLEKAHEVARATLAKLAREGALRE